MSIDHQPLRPKPVIEYPADALPFAVLRHFPVEERDDVKQLFDNVTLDIMTAFVDWRLKQCFQLLGQPYSSYKEKVPANGAVAQVWQHRDLQKSADLAIVHRMGEAQFLVEVAEGANVLVLYKGDPLLQKGPAVLLCRTKPGAKFENFTEGDKTVFSAAFVPRVQAQEDFEHTRKHALGIKHACSSQHFHI